MAGEFTYQPEWDPKTVWTTTAICLDLAPSCSCLFPSLYPSPRVPSGSGWPKSEASRSEVLMPGCWCFSFWKQTAFFRGNFPILSRDPSFWKATKNPGELAGFEKNDG